jgi:hypothetical protein
MPYCKFITVQPLKIRNAAAVSIMASDKGNLQHRKRRLSITYRKVKLDKVKPIAPLGKVAEILQEHFNIKS